MSLPPLNPNKTAAGIILDPRTLERVVPTSRRRDGTQRKELKIRPGFTPQEDVGVFRSTRQAAHESRKSAIPGSNRPPPPATTSKPDNPFAQPVQAKSKAQLKNEKRREKKKVVESTKAWDEESSGDEEEGLREAFAKADMGHRLEKGEDAFPPLGESSRKIDSIGGGSSASKKQDEGVAAPADEPSIASKTATRTEETSTDPTPQEKPSAKPTQKPHPIQGGRSGPIGLAFPPPLEADKPKPPPPTTRSDSATTWRSNRPAVSKAPAPTASSSVVPADESTYATTPEAEAKIRARNEASARSNQARNGPRNQKRVAKERPIPAAPPPKPEPRVRKEVRIRQGGANDIGSLADRVKNLVLENGGGRTASPRTRKTEAKSDATA